MSDKFAIFHDIPKASDIKIHYIECTAYTGRDLTAKTTEWFTAPNFLAAMEIANNLAKKHNMRYRACKWCKPSSSLI